MRMSASPTLISWRRNSSVRTLSSDNVCLAGLLPGSDLRYLFSPLSDVRSRISGARFSDALKSCAGGTSRTDMDPRLTGRVILLPAERYFDRTFRSEYCL